MPTTKGISSMLAIAAESKYRLPDVALDPDVNGPKPVSSLLPSHVHADGGRLLE